jgi:hypothetical protein
MPAPVKAHKTLSKNHALNQVGAVSEKKTKKSKNKKNKKKVKDKVEDVENVKVSDDEDSDADDVDIDELFASAKNDKKALRKLREQEEEEAEEAAAEEFEAIERARASESANYGVIKSPNMPDIINPEAPVERIDPETGYPVYKAHLLKVGEGGGTPLCPFDCNCCF